MSAPLEPYTLATSGELPTWGAPTTQFFTWMKWPHQPEDDEKIYRIKIAGVKNASGIMFMEVVYQTWSGPSGDLDLEDSRMILMSEKGYERLHARLPQTHRLCTGERFQHPNSVSLDWEMLRAQEPGLLDMWFEP